MVRRHDAVDDDGLDGGLEVVLCEGLLDGDLDNLDLDIDNADALGEGVDLEGDASESSGRSRRKAEA